MDTIIFGGTFNPLHIGHLHLIEEIYKIYNPRQIVFVPSNIPAHKELSGSVKAIDRYKMLKLALKKIPYIKIDDCEIKRGGISYTIDSVKYLKNKYKINGKPGLIIGDDLIKGFSSWRDVEELSSLVKLLVFHRNSSEKLDFEFDHEYINNKIVDISSTEIREKIIADKAYRFLIPSEVYKYINKNDLYKEI